MMGQTFRGTFADVFSELQNPNELAYGTDAPANSDPNGDGLTNEEESAFFTSPFNADTDGDGFTDGGEADQGHDPLDPDDAPASEWITLTGDLGEDEVKTRELTVTVPAGQSRLFAVALFSDEYPEYTEDSSEYNDILTWDVTPASGAPLSGSVDVNSRHSAWEGGVALGGYDPVCVEGFRTLTAPADGPLTVGISLTAKNIGDGALPSTVMVGVMAAGFIDKSPIYAADSGSDSDNFFLREQNGSGGSDHENLDIYYSLGLDGFSVSDVKIKVYRGDTSTLETTLDGERNADGSYKTGNGFHITWTPEITDLPEGHPGFYRLQLAVSVEGQSNPVLQTSIDDVDADTPGWQCPQDCLAVHDLVWKHRPVVYVHVDETGTPTSPTEFIANSALNTVAPDSAGHFYDLFSDGDATTGDWSSFTPNQQAILTSDADDRVLYHSANRADAQNFIFLQYWMFENFSRRPFGIFGLPANPNVQHEGDVEHCHITIRLKDLNVSLLKAKWLSPFAATASQHYYAQTLKWDLNDSASSANAHSQEHVEHVNNRLVVYVAHGAHATYFASDPNIAVEGGALGTQIQYEAIPGLSGYDVTSPAKTFPSYELWHVDSAPLGMFQGHWGFFDPNDTGSFSENGPPGPNDRSANTSGGGRVNLRMHPKELHNLSRKTSQQTELFIP